MHKSLNIKNIASLQLAVCCLNISEGRNAQILEQIANAAVSNQDKWDCKNQDNLKNIFKCKSTILSVYMDQYYNRGNITIAAPIDYLKQTIVQACKVAYELVDLRCHIDPGHPRLGSVDLIPIHPLSRSVTLEMCADVARVVSRELSEDILGTSFFYFGMNDQQRRNLVQKRKEMNWFSKSSLIRTPDIGYYDEKYGITGVGAIPYMSVLNVSLETMDLSIGQEMANKIRSSNKETGLPGIQAMAFLKQHGVEIACNIDTNPLDNDKPVFQTTFDQVEYSIKKLCDEKNLKVIGETLKGFTPDEAYNLAYHALCTGDSQIWKKSGSMLM